jgi:4'-phosphopantetheinyl transferase
MSCPQDVDVWLIHLPENLQGEALSLSPDESARAARFVFDRDRARFSVAHSALRDILSRYTLQLPLAIQLRTGEKGKPYLADYPATRFNLSHSGCWAMVAVASRREVGVDIECIRAERSTGGIADRFFAPAEVRELMETPEERRVSAFFNCWSRKEAYIKARGEGLHIPLDSFEVSLGEDAVLRRAEDRDRWSMCALLAPPGYAAALVVEGSGCRVRQLAWTPAHPET